MAGDAPHLNTMLSPNLTEIGAGVAKVGNTYFMVIDCALPTSSGLAPISTPGPGDPIVGTSAPSDFIVPLVTSSPDENGLVYHDVQYGQTLWAIAIEYGVKIDEIRALNGMGPETEIYQGDRLLVRKDVPPALATELVEVIETLTIPVQNITSTSFPTITPIYTEMPRLIADTPDEKSENNSPTGIIIGLVLGVMLFAGLLSWMSSRRQP